MLVFVISTRKRNSFYSPAKVQRREGERKEKKEEKRKDRARLE